MLVGEAMVLFTFQSNDKRSLSCFYFYVKDMRMRRLLVGMKIVINFQLPSCILFCRERDSIEMVAWHIHVKSGWVSLELDLQVE